MRREGEEEGEEGMLLTTLTKCDGISASGWSHLSAFHLHPNHLCVVFSVYSFFAVAVQAHANIGE